MNKAIFLDRDGTLTDESCYPNFFPENCKLVDKNIPEVLKKLKQK
jgi:histidinol phosphatase-like enzyme